MKFWDYMVTSFDELGWEHAMLWGLFAGFFIGLLIGYGVFGI